MVPERRVAAIEESSATALFVSKIPDEDVDELDMLIDDILGGVGSCQKGVHKMSAPEARVNKTVAALQDKADTFISAGGPSLPRCRPQNSFRTCSMLPEELHGLGRTVLGDYADPADPATNAPARFSNAVDGITAAAQPRRPEVGCFASTEPLQELRVLAAAAPTLTCAVVPAAPTTADEVARIPPPRLPPPLVGSLVKRFEVTCPAINGSFKPRCAESSPPAAPLVLLDEPVGGDDVEREQDASVTREAETSTGTCTAGTTTSATRTLQAPARPSGKALVDEAITELEATTLNF